MMIWQTGTSSFNLKDVTTPHCTSVSMSSHTQMDTQTGDDDHSCQQTPCCDCHLPASQPLNCHSPVHKLSAVCVTRLSTNSVLWASQACHSPVHKLCAVGVTGLSLTCPQNSVLWASQACHSPVHKLCAVGMTQACH